ncbi:ATP-binding cassette domain-containing protein [Brevundimonas sp. Marseille-Q4549]
MSLACRLKARHGDFVVEADFATDRQVLALTGPSGAGKTTVLNVIAGLIAAERLDLTVGGRRIVETDTGLNPPAYRRRIGYVFQDGRLFPHLSVAQNIAFGRRYAAAPVPVEPILALLDLQNLAERRPATLSGGEMRRVSIARALSARPALLLLDEPFAGLDARRRGALIPYLLRLRDEAGLPMILVSHDPRDVGEIAQTVVEMDYGLMQDGQGSESDVPAAR